MAKETAPGPDAADQSDWVVHAMAHGVPSYEAWLLTPEEITKKFGPLPPAEPTTTEV